MLKIYLKDLFLRYASGQSYKHFTLVNYDSKVVADWKTYYDPRVVIYEHKMFIRLATELNFNLARYNYESDHSFYFDSTIDLLFLEYR